MIQSCEEPFYIRKMPIGWRATSFLPISKSVKQKAASHLKKVFFLRWLVLYEKALASTHITDVSQVCLIRNNS
jgi:hypothetical protein